MGMAASRRGSRARVVLARGFAVLAITIVGATIFPPTHVTSTMPWDAASVAPDDRTVTITYSGSDQDVGPRDRCWTGAAPVVVDRGDHVDVTLELLAAWSLVAFLPLGDGGCNGAGHPRTSTFELPAPLAGRPLRDTYQRGERRGVFPGDRAITLAPGPELTEETTQRWGTHDALLKRTYRLPEPHAGTTLYLLQAPFGGSPFGAGETTATLVVHGQPARYVEGPVGSDLEWQEHGQWIRISAYQDRPAQDELLQIAERSRVP